MGIEWSRKVFGGEMRNRCQERKEGSTRSEEGKSRKREEGVLFSREM